jgi:hypothetical protein
MKRVLFLLVLAVMAVSLTACSEGEFNDWIDYLTISCELSHGLSINCNNKATYERNPGYWQDLYITAAEPVAVPNSPLPPPPRTTPPGEMPDCYIVGQKDDLFGRWYYSFNCAE